MGTSRCESIKKAAAEDNSSVFKINDQTQKSVVCKGLMIDTGATSHIIKEISKFKNFDDSLQSDNHFLRAETNNPTDMQHPFWNWFTLT